MNLFRKPKISVIVVVYNMQREAVRTLHSMSSRYQGISDKEYEVIVVENGSSEPLSENEVRKHGNNFHYYYLNNASPSPAGAINYGVQKSKGKMLCLMIDGARILTPGILKYALRALKAYKNPVISIPGWILGKNRNAKSDKNYSKKVEDELLKQINWPEDGYRLFDIGVLDGTSQWGWLMPAGESTCLFLLKAIYNELGGMSEDFDEPGGGFVNLDIYHQVCDHPRTELIVLLGEGAFHQFHGGAASGLSLEKLQPVLKKWRQQYQDIRKQEYREVSSKAPDYWGYIWDQYLQVTEYSINTAIRKINQGYKPGPESIWVKGLNNSLFEKSPKISIVIIVYNMKREACRTLLSLSSKYQRVPESEYEVIIVENGSTHPLDQKKIEGLGSNYRYYYLKNASPSPAHAINFGVKQARGKMIGLMVDGARILTPGIIQYALRAFYGFENPLLSTLGWHLGNEVQYVAFQNGYDKEVEDSLLKQINWPKDGYKLFSISTFAGSSRHGWFLPIAESNCCFLLKKTFQKMGGFDEKFNEPGGGYCNLDFYKRACEFKGINLVILLGEGSFHQIHGGAATGIAIDDPKRRYWTQQYKNIRGTDFSCPRTIPEYWGHVPKEMLPMLKYSIEKLIEIKEKNFLNTYYD